MAIEHTVVEAIHKWQLDQRVHGDEEAVRLTALTNALKGSDRLKVVRAFFIYLQSATKYRSIWIPQIAALMNAPASSSRPCPASPANESGFRSKKPSALRSGVARELNPPSLSSHMTTAWSGRCGTDDG